MDNIHSHIELIYDAVTHPDGWAQLMQTLVQDFDANMGFLVTEKMDGSRIFAAELINMPSELMQEYDRYYLARDEWLNVAKTLPIGRFYQSHKLVDQRRYLNSESYYDFNRKLDIISAIGGFIDVSDDIGLRFNLQRGQQGHFGDELLAHLNLLLPHFRRALDLQHRLNLLDERYQGTDALMNKMPFGSLLIDDDYKIRYLNQKADRILSRHRYIDIRNERVLPSGKNNLRFLGLVRSAIAAGQGESAAAGGSCRLVDPHSGEHVEIHVAPYCRDDRHFGFAWRSTFALAILNSSGDRPVLDTATLQALYGFSPKEARVATLLAKGLNAAQIAQTTHTSINTVRSHIKSLYHKTGTQGLGGLLLLLSQSLATMED